MAVAFDAELSMLAAEIVRDAVLVYELGTSLPALAAWDTGMFGSLDATGSFAALTGSFAAVTGSFPALTGSFRMAAQETGEPPATLKRVFKLPDRLPGILLPPEPDLAAMARSAPLMTGLDALARWLGKNGRLVTGDDELTGDDAVDAVRQLGTGPAGLPFLWEYALTSHWLQLEQSADRRRTWAIIGPTAWHWANGDDRGALHVWAVVFAAVMAHALETMAAADPKAARKFDFQGQGVALAVSLFLGRRSGVTVREAGDLVREGAIGNRPGSRARRAWDAWVRQHGDPAHQLLGELAALGAVTVPRTADGIVELTPLALWALRQQFALDRVSVPLLRPASDRLSAADLVARADAVGDTDFNAAFAHWIRGRDPDQAARELLIYAGSSDAHGRLAAVDIARRIGVPAYHAWTDALQRSELRVYARITLSTMAADLPESALPPVLEPDPDDVAWLATDLLAQACAAGEPDPDEIAAQFAAAVPAGEEARTLSRMAQSAHPDAARVLDALGDNHPSRRVAREARKAARALVKNRVPAGGRRIPARAAGR